MNAKSLRRYTALALAATGFLACSRAPAPAPAPAPPPAAPEQSPAPAPLAPGLAPAPSLPWQCNGSLPREAGPVQLDSATPGGQWDALGATLSLEPPADREALARPAQPAVDAGRDPLGWPFSSFYFLRGSEAIILSPQELAVATRSAEIADLVSYLRTLRPAPTAAVLGSFAIVPQGATSRIDLRAGACRAALPAADDASAADAEFGMLARHLGELGGLSGAYLAKGELVLVGPPRTSSSPPALTVDDLSRAYQAVFKQCGCTGPLNGHACDGAFVSIDPDPQALFAPARVVLAPCLLGSHMGQVFTQADVLIKELASGYDVTTGDPLPTPPGHLTEPAFGLASRDLQTSGVWTRYWLFADAHSSDSFLEISDAADGHSQIFVGGFHLSLGIETTDEQGRVLSTNDPENEERFRQRPGPGDRFARHINQSWLSRYSPYYPILRELDNYARLIQIMGWLKAYHPNAARETLLAHLPQRYEATPRQIALRAGASLAVDEESGHASSIPLLTYGGVVGRNIVQVGVRSTSVRIVQVGQVQARLATRVIRPESSKFIARGMPGVSRASGSMPATIIKTSKEPLHTTALHKGPGVLHGQPIATRSPLLGLEGTGTPWRSPAPTTAARPPPSIVPRSAISQSDKSVSWTVSQGPTGPVQSSALPPLHMAPPRTAPMKLKITTSTEELTVGLPSGRLGTGVSEETVVAEVNGGVTASAYGEVTPSLVVSKVPSRSTAALPPPRSTVPIWRPGPTSAGARAVAMAAQDTAAEEAEADGAEEEDGSGRRRSSRRARSRHLQSSALPALEKEGGVLANVAVADAREAVGEALAALLGQESQVALNLPRLQSAPTSAVRLLPETESRAELDEHPPRLLPVSIDEAAGRALVGNLRLPWKGLVAFNAELKAHPEQVRELWRSALPAEQQPVFLAGALPLAQSVVLARTLLTPREQRPIMLAIRSDRPLEQSYRRLLHAPSEALGGGRIRPMEIPLYQSSALVPGWQAVSSAAAVPPGFGVVAVDGSSAESELLVARMALLGRLVGKTLIWMNTDEHRLPEATLRRILGADLVEDVLLCAGGPGASHVLDDVVAAVRRGEAVVPALRARPSAEAPVVLLGGY